MNPHLALTRPLPGSEKIEVRMRIFLYRGLPVCV